MITTVFVVSNASINRQLVSENNDQSFKPPHAYSKPETTYMDIQKTVLAACRCLNLVIYICWILAMPVIKWS